MSVPTETEIARSLGISRQSLMRARQSGRCGQSRNPEVLRRELAESRSARDRYQTAAAEEKELQVARLKGELIDREKVLNTFFGTTKAVRERLEQWPAQVAAEL